MNRAIVIRLLSAAALVGLVVTGGSGKTQSAAAQPGVLWQDDYEADTNGWTAMGSQAKASQITEAGRAKSGKGALAFTYSISMQKPADGSPPSFGILARPTPDGVLTKMRSMSFWVRTDHDTPLLMALSEKDGGRYVSIFWSPKDTWQHVTLTPADFWLSDDKNDPKDPDGKLDLDQVDNIGIVSVWSFLAMTVGDNPMGAALFGKHTGTHTMLLDDFTVRSDAPQDAATAPADPAGGKALWIDPLTRDALSWMPLGEMQLHLEKSGAFLKSRSMRVDYTQSPGKFVALVHDARRVRLAKADRLNFEIASKLNFKLIISLEEKNGAKYNVTIDVPGSSVPTRKSIAFSDFQIADDSPKDENGKLDLSQVKTILLVDPTGMYDQSNQANTFWLGPLSAEASAK